MFDGTDNPTSKSTTAASASAKPRVYELGSLFGDLEKDATLRYEAKRDGNRLGPITALNGLDERLGGAWMPGLHIVHGSPGVGKTAFALQIAATCECPALFVTCEMPPLELLRRLMARKTSTFLGKYKSGELSPDTVLSHVRQAADAAQRMFLMDATQAPATSGDIQMGATTARQSAPENPHLLIVVDSLHSWADAVSSGGVDEYERIGQACATLRQVAAALTCPVIAIAERNRSSMGKGGQNSGAGSRKIEYGAETVIGLNATTTDDEGCPVYDARGETEVKAVFGKNRHGGTGKPVSLMFHAACQSYRELPT